FCKKVQMVFQDPYASLNPRMTVSNIIGEGIDIHKMYTGQERQKRIYELLELVGLNAEHANRFPHEFSGGQRQRIVIARALAIEPECIICDEPISALDVSIQAQIINLLKRLQNEMKLTYLFIAHDLNVVKYISDRVVVMYLGNIVEISPSSTLYSNPVHPYTKALLSAIPMPDPELERSKKRIMLTGDVPSPIDLPAGCAFASRCPYATDQCRTQTPKMEDLGDGHMVACLRQREISAQE
ncbi:MAG: ATP-binding cassette domain-containing protein, partial [Eubacteriales bacterium]|nr:ATP-binding cassette domain-containing protein [Eubacteriales bacterium]